MKLKIDRDSLQNLHKQIELAWHNLLAFCSNVPVIVSNYENFNCYSTNDKNKRIEMDVLSVRFMGKLGHCPAFMLLDFVTASPTIVFV